MKNEYKVYLSGPITGLHYGEAIGWTDYAKTKLTIAGIEGYRPLRGKKFLKDETEALSAMGYDENPISTPQGIVHRDRYDVETCDVMLVNLSGAKRVSIGTMFEVAWAFILHKPIVLFMEKEGNIHHHAFVTQACSYWVYNLDYAIELTETILLDR
jgi:nucleoside 2-deoxyribosyltransferase